MTLWCIGYFSLIHWLLRQAPACMGVDRFFSLVMYSYVARFDERSFSYAEVILVRRFLLALTPSLSAFGGMFEQTHTLLMYMVMVLMVAISYNDYKQPYRYNILHYTDQFSMGLLVVVLACAATLREVINLL